jgi:SMI1/KNR4 family protein SUKH-1
MPSSNPPAIESVEARLARKLPSAFRDFLVRSNGGEIELLELPWEVTPIEEIIPITDEARKWPSFPPGGVSVGDDGCGNHLVFIPSALDTESFAPALYVWWHEGGELEIVGADFNAALSKG